MAEWSKNIWNLSLQPLKILHFQYHSGYGQRTWQGGDLPWGVPIHKFTWHSDCVRMPIDTKLDRTVTYRDWFLSIKSHALWSRGLGWSREKLNSLYSPTEVTKNGRMVTYPEGLLPISRMTFWSSGLAKSRDKLNSLHLHYYSAYDNQFYQVGDLPCGFPSYSHMTFIQVILI